MAGAAVIVRSWQRATAVDRHALEDAGRLLPADPAGRRLRRFINAAEHLYTKAYQALGLQNISTAQS